MEVEEKRAASRFEVVKRDALKATIGKMLGKSAREVSRYLLALALK